MTDTIRALEPPLEHSLTQHRADLTGYCYRMLGSTFEAEDAAQETLLRAWRSFGSFEGRASVRSWLYRIATNVCYDALRGIKGRARPVDLGPARSGDDRFGIPLTEDTWIEPVLDARIARANDDPAEAAEMHESIELAFVAALRYLPPKQRAVLILKDVLRWKAEEVARLLDTTVQSVNSALQRARSTIAKRSDQVESPARMDDRQKALLVRYVDAFERYDVNALTSLLHEDAA